MIQFLIILITLISVGYLLVIGKTIFIPLIIAIFIWFVLKALADFFYHKLYIKNKFLSNMLAFIGLLGFILIPIELAISSVKQIIEVLPTYEKNFFDILAAIFKIMPIDEQNIINDFQEHFPITEFLTTIAAGLTSYASSLVLVLLYLLFIMTEQRIFKHKIAIVIKNGGYNKDYIFNILNDINTKVTKYLCYKTVISFVTAVVSYIIMLAFGLDFAGFWVILIFLLNFIPSIGSIISTIMPAILAAIQFKSLPLALGLFLCISSAQFIIGNLIEPKLIGKILNLSPLTILISLIIWSSLWGITGMFIAVPFTVILKIIFSEFDATKPIAVILSKEGVV